MPAKMLRRLCEILPALLIALAVAGSALAQSAPQPAQPPSGPVTSAPMTALVDQLLDLFPKFEGEVLESQNGTLTLGAGVKAGARPGLEVELFREGREIRHPRTGEVLGRAEDSLGTGRITQAQETLSVAQAPAGVEIKPGDRFRVSSAKVGIVLVPLLGSLRETLVETATQELVERLSATGRFRVTMGDTINVFLAQQRLTATDFLAGKGVREASERFKADNILAVHFTRAQGKPFMDVRFFAAPRPDPAIATSFFVPPSTLRAANPGPRFSQGGPANPPQAKPRTLLQRLLGGDLEAGSYSTGDNSLPLREVAKFNFPVLAMDIAVAPADKLPHMVVSDGDQIYMYRIVNQKVEPEWTKSVRSLGKVFSLQLADLNGDGHLEVIGNRYASKIGLNSFVIETKDGKPSMAIEYVSDFLYAVDLKGEGVKQTLWMQRFSPEFFFTTGQADQMTLKNGKLSTEKSGTGAVVVPAHGGRLLERDGQGYPVAGPHRRVQPAADRGRGRGRGLALVDGGGRRVHVHRAGRFGLVVEEPAQQVLQDRADPARGGPRRRRDRRADRPPEPGPGGAARGGLQGTGRLPPAVHQLGLRGRHHLPRVVQDRGLDPADDHRGGGAVQRRDPEVGRRDPDHHDRAAGVSLP